MPVVNTMDLPRPQNWQEFEIMTAAALRLKWQSPNLQLNGRPGQEQFGVDIWGPDDLSRPTAVQCKLTVKSLTMPIIEDELEKALAFGSPLATIYIATTLSNDSHLSQEIRALSMTRAQAGLPSVGILFWNDIVDGLVIDPAVFRNFYPQIDLAGITTAPGFDYLMRWIDLGWYGTNLWDRIELVLGEFGWMAQEDPDQLRVVFEQIEAQASKIISGKTAKDIRDLLHKLTAAIFPEGGKPDFVEAKLLAEQVDHRIRQRLTNASAEESQALRLGIRLSAVNLADTDLELSGFDRLVRDVRDFLKSRCTNEVEERIKRIRDGYASNYATSLYDLVVRECVRTPAIPKIVDPES